jgi:hypothetical protein
LIEFFAPFGFRLESILETIASGKLGKAALFEPVLEE